MTDEEQNNESQNKMLGNLRVIDQGAFNELAGKLDTLITEATTQASQLGTMIEGATDAGSSAEEARSELDQRLVVSTRVLKVTKDQLTRIKEGLTQLGQQQQHIDGFAGDLSSQLSSFRQHVDGVVASVDERVQTALTGIEEQVNEVSDQIGATAEHAGSQIDGATERLDSHRRDAELQQQSAETLLQAANALGEQFAAMQTQLGKSVARFESGLKQAMTEIAGGAEQTQRSSSKLDEQVFALKQRVTAFSDGLEQWLKPALEDIDARREDVDRATTTLGERFTELDERLDTAQEKIERKLSSNHETIERELTGGVSRIETSLTDRLDAALEAIRSRSDRTDGLQSELRADIARLDEQVTVTLEDLKHVCDAVGGQAVEQVRPMVERLLGKLEEAGLTESDLIERLTDVEQRLDAAADRVESAIRPSLEALTAQGERAEANREEIRSISLDLQRDLGVAVEQLDSQMSTTAERNQKVFEARVRELLDRLDTTQERVDERLSDSISDLETRRQAADAEALGQRTQISDTQNELSETVNRIEERVGETLSSLETQQQKISDRTGVVDRRLGEVDTQLTNMARTLPKLETSLRPALEELSAQGKRAESSRDEIRSISRDLHSDLSATVSRIESRVGESISELEARRGRADEDALAHRSQISDSQKDLAAVVSRIESRVGDTLGSLDTQQQKMTERTALVDRRLSELDGNLAKVAETLPRFEPALAAVERANRKVGKVDARLEGRLAGLEQKIKGIDDRLATSVNETLEGIACKAEDRDAEQAAFLADVQSLRSELSEFRESVTQHADEQGQTLRETIDGLHERLRGALTPAVTALRAQLEGIDDRVGGRVAEAISTLQHDHSTRKDGDATLEQSVAACREQIQTLPEDLAVRLTDISGELRTANDLANERLGETSRLMRRELEAVRERLDQTDVAGGQLETMSGEVSNLGERLDRRIVSLQESIAKIGEQFGVERLEAGRGRAESGALTMDLPLELGELRESVLALGSLISDRRDEGATTDHELSSLRTTVESLRSQFGDQLTEVGQRVDEAMGELEASDPSKPALDGAALRTTLEHIEDGLAALQRRPLVSEGDGVVVAGESDSGAVSGEGEVISSVERHLDYLGEQMTALGARLANLEPSNDLGPMSGGHHKNDDGKVVDRRLAEIQSQLQDVTQQIGDRIALAMADIESKQVPVALSGDTAGQVELIITRLEERFESVVADSVAGGGDSSSSVASPDLERSIQYLQEQLTALGARLANFETDGGSIPGMAMLGGGGSSGLEGESGDRLERLEQKIGGLLDRMENFGTSVDAATNPITTDQFDQRLEDLRGRLDSATQRVDERVSEILTELRRTGPATHPAGPVQSPGRNLIERLVDAVNSGNSQIIFDFVASEYAEQALAERGAEERVAVYMSIHEEAGTLEVRQVEESSRAAVVAVVQNRSTLDQFRFELELQTDSPHKILIVNIDEV